MKVLVIGVTGMIGAAVAAALSGGHQVIGASRTRSKLKVGIADPASLEAALAAAAREAGGRIDAVISAAGAARFAPPGAVSGR